MKCQALFSCKLYSKYTILYKDRGSIIEDLMRQNLW